MATCPHCFADVLWIAHDIATPHTEPRSGSSGGGSVLLPVVVMVSLVALALVMWVVRRAGENA